MAFSKYIWMYWHQGLESAPEIVQKCISQWKKLHPDWEVKVLDQKSIEELIDPLPIPSEKLAKMSFAHRSDLIRTQLLIQYGGVWVDPTTFPTLPLDNWLLAHKTNDLFMFLSPGRDRIMSNWFIAASANNILMKKVYDDLIYYWSEYNFRNLGREDKKNELFLNQLINRNLNFPRLWFTDFFTKWLRVYPYMVYHYKVYDVIKKDFKCKVLWDNMMKISSNLPHRLQNLGLLNPITPEIKDWIDHSTVPVHKLTWKLPSTKIPSKSILDYLLYNE